jgi:hypothetical protein
MSPNIGEIEGKIKNRNISAWGGLDHNVPQVSADVHMMIHKRTPAPPGMRAGISQILSSLKNSLGHFFRNRMWTGGLGCGKKNETIRARSYVGNGMDIA